MLAKVLLLPGAFHGSWCFKYITPILSNLNYKCIPIDYQKTFPPNPPNTVQHYVDHTINCILNEAKLEPSLPMYIIGHSLGG